MKKIVSLFKRDYEGTRQVYDEIVPGAEWVVNGEGVATIKWDGTACLLRGEILYRRYDAKAGRTPPLGWIQCEDAPDEHTGHWPGWVPVSGDNPADKWYVVALQTSAPIVPWTYELVGPHFQGNPYDLSLDMFLPHAAHLLGNRPRDFPGIRAYLEAMPGIEGIVWWRDFTDQDCDKVKIKRRDFGMPWPTPEARRALR